MACRDYRFAWQQKGDRYLAPGRAWLIFDLDGTWVDSAPDIAEASWGSSAAARLPAGVSEFAVLGADRGEPVKMVKCEIVDLEVPASCEIVIEGFIDPHEQWE